MSLIRQVFSYGSASSATLGLLFLLHVVAGRLLGVENYGRFSFAMAFAELFAPLLDPGLYYLSIREISRKPETAERYIAHSVTWKLISAIPGFVIIVGGARLIHDSPLTLTIVALMAIARILHSAKDAVRPALMAREFFGLDALSLTFERVSLLALSTWMLLLGHGPVALAWVFVAVRSADLTLVTAMVRAKVARVGIGRDLSFLSGMLTEALPIGAFYITLRIYSYVDTVMLSAMRGDIEVGWYAAAYRLYEGPMIVPAIIATVFMPRLSRMFAEGPRKFLPLLLRGLGLVGAAGLAIAMAGIVVAAWLITLFYGEEYANSILALRILLAGLPFAFTINYLQTVMISINRQRLVFVVAVVGLIINVAANFFLIPRYGYVGAASATIGVEALVCLVLLWTVLTIVRSSRLQSGLA